ncbi:TonB-dependent receptor [Chitinophaga barathri]|uniref:PEGA domain-containing protein n=1 Tax=Chitinophaga barathri TaxID=1647451 RepID=A0A3N4M8B9_9BACT|nr:TonB-dependent receptor [Chitinophaga barathri]RPD39812.1 PEGA domain-containing protein [Chitinophaga barathri]
MKKLIQFLYLLLPFAAFAGNTANEPEYGSIKGMISTNEGSPAIAVTVVVKGANKHGITREDGSFYINRVPVGKFQLEVSLVGYETLRQDVTVEKGQTTAVNLELQVSSTQLREVTITGGVSNKFVTKESEQIARLPIKNLENPQVYHTVGQVVMKEQLVIERTDIYRNIAGAVPNFSAGGSQGLSLRGFSGTIGMRNGMATSAIVPLNPVILERIEAIKGPSGTLFGSNRNTSFGGVFNYVTKKPYDHFGGEVSLTGGSFEFARITADINTPVNKSKTMLFRLNTAFQSEGSFQDQGYNKNFTIAPVFTYQLNDRTKLTVDAEMTRGYYTTTTIGISAAALGKMSARNFKDLQLPYKQSLINNGVDIANGINNLQFKLEYKMSDQWKSETNFLYSEGFYKSLLWTSLNFLTDSTIARGMRNQTPETFGNIQVQQNFIGDFKIGNFRNRVVIGLDYNYNYNELYRAVFTYDTINLRRNIPDMSAQKIDDRSAAAGFNGTSTKAYNYGIYISDVFNITPSLMAMLSLRADRYTTDGTYSFATSKFTGGYKQNALSPKLGLVYQVVKDKVSLFANYMNGFANLGPATQPDGTILELKPQYANQWEGGIKVDAFNKKLNATVNYYNIDVTNSTRLETIDSKQFTVQDGTQLSRGFEAEVIANPIPGLNIFAGYAYNDNTYKKATPALEGKTLMASPKNVANFWASYFLTRGKARGLGFGIGGNYVSDSWFESSNVFVLPGYTLLNVGLYYDQPKYRFSLKGNNLLNEEYWISTGTPQKTINFLASVAVNF